MVDRQTSTFSLSAMEKILVPRKADMESGIVCELEAVPSKLTSETQWTLETEMGVCKCLSHVECSELDPLNTGDEPAGNGLDSASVSSVSTGSCDEIDVADCDASTPCWSELSVCERFKLVVFKWIGKGLGLVALLYIFICSLDLLSSAFRILGGKSAGGVFNNSDLLQNPITGLMIGIMATVLVQSSSTSSSIIVTMVASGIMDVKVAIPMIMGANIGTSVTNTLVSMTQCNNRREFRRAFSGATVHDMFNWLTVIILLPLEYFTGYLYHLTLAITQSMKMETYSGGKQQLLKALTDPVTSLVVKVDKKVISKIAEGHDEYLNKSLIKKYCKYDDAKQPVERCFSICSQFDDADNVVGALLLVFSLGLLCLCLILMVKLLHSLLKGSIAKMIKKTLNADFPGCFHWLTGYVAILIGAVMTVLVQSSSVFTSALTPLVGLGIIKVERMYPLTLGSNIGTTGTGLLAAMAASGDKLPIALQIALCHLFFNITGIILFYPIPCMRRIPIRCAKFLGRVTSKYRWFAVAYLILMFFVLPAGVFLLSFAGSIASICAAAIIVPIVLFVLVLNILQRKCSSCLPKCLRTWKFLPKCLRSLEPIDRVIMKLVGVVKRCCPCLGKCCVAKKKTSFTDIVKKAGLKEIEIKVDLEPSPVSSAASSRLLLDSNSLKVNPKIYV